MKLYSSNRNTRVTLELRNFRLHPSSSQSPYIFSLRSPLYSDCPSSLSTFRTFDWHDNRNFYLTSFDTRFLPVKLTVFNSCWVKWVTMVGRSFTLGVCMLTFLDLNRLLDLLELLFKQGPLRSFIVSLYN